MKLTLAAALIALAAPAAAQAQTVSPAIKAALADAGRPQADKDRDAARHPGELLAFAGIKPGDKVVDFMMGGGYWTRILAGTVGPKGHVYAYQAAEFIQRMPKYGADQKAAVAGYANVTPSSESLAALAFPSGLDAVITVQNWHDLHLSFAPPTLSDSVAKSLYASLKPGGVLLVIDHVANDDAAGKAPNTLHRIDPVAARAEIEAAGFKFEGESTLLKNPQDDHTLKVFDPALRGHTDQFVYKFRKPK